MLDLLKLVLLLGLMVVLLIRKWDLGLVLLVNTGLVAVLFAYPPLALLKSIGLGLIASDTLNLAAAVFLVLMLAELMRRTRAMEKMVRSLQVVVPDSRIVLALMPLMIGMMPMLGGAMFSAPMVNEVGTRLNLTPDRKTFINYWFRHSMEYVFPLYSSLLMIAALLEVSVFDFARVSWPLTVAALVGGIIWGLVGIRPIPSSHEVENKEQVWRELLSGIWPMLLVILLVVVFKFNMLLSLIGVIGLQLTVHRIGPGQWGDVIKCSFPIHTFSAILGVMVFKHVLEDAGAVQQIPLALSSLGLPPLFISFLVPLIVGLLTGAAPAALAISVPLVAPLLFALPVDPMAVGVWLFATGFSGVLLSPMHLCLALTREYFGANWGQLYRAIVPSVTVVLAVALGIVMTR
ncbi:MAG: DUF401 family protein [Anaerolineae bacterium]|nr:DUF401 family protein [Anaerolineae bacterium]